MKHTLQIISIATALAAAGCSTQGLPRGARVVGGGPKIDWQPPVTGTAILVERTTGRIIKTETVEHSASCVSRFQFEPERDAEALQAALGTIPTNACFVLYFVPEPKRK